MSPGGRPSMPGREFVLAEADQQAYVEHLRAAFPDVGFLPPDRDFRYGKPPPPAELQPTLANMHPRLFCTISFTPGWMPELTRNSDGSLSVTDPPLPDASIQRGGWISEPRIATGPFGRQESKAARFTSAARRGMRRI